VISALKGLIMSFASSRQGNLALAAICLSALMFGFEISSVPAILPTLERVLHADFQELQWTMNAYTIAVATVLMAAGTLADRFGRKRLLVAAIVAFGGTSVLCGLAPNMMILIVGRALQGASGGAMLICGIAVLSHQFSTAADRARAFGWWGIVTGFGLGIGPVIGSGIAALMGWAWVFLIHGFIAVLTVILAWRGVRESKDPAARRLDLAGIATLSLAVFCVAFIITQGGELGFTSPTALAIIATAMLSLIAFIIVEQIVPHPMFDFSVFRIRPFSGALFGSMGMNFSFWPFMIYLPIWFQAGLGLDGLTAGLALLAYTLPTLVVPPFAERLSLRLGAGTVIPAGLFVIGLGFFIMKLGTSGGSLALATTLIGALLAGIGLGATNTPVTNTTTGSVSSDRAGMASGIDMSARMISLAINIALMGFVLLEGVQKRLSAASGAFDTALLRRAAEQIAAGNVSALDQSALGASKALGSAALAGGFGGVMLYGAIGVWVLAALSFFTFGRGKRDADSAS
jgi:EmrB/QacA subfamily drug resistance transporter